MSTLSKEKILEAVNKTVDRASDLGDKWIGTLIGKVLDDERDNLLYIVKEDNLELASILVLNLAMTCQHAEEQLKQLEEF